MLKRVEVGGACDKWLITAMFCGLREIVKAGIAGALDGHIDCTPEEDNVREDETERSKTVIQMATVVCWTLLS